MKKKPIHQLLRLRKKIHQKFLLTKTQIFPYLIAIQVESHLLKVIKKKNLDNQKIDPQHKVFVLTSVQLKAIEYQLFRNIIVAIPCIIICK